MRLIPMTLLTLLLTAPATVHGQSLLLHGAGGANIHDDGYSVAAGLGFTPVSRIEFLGSVEQTHLFSRTDTYPSGTSSFRGGTFTLASAEVRLSVFERERIGPYGLVGFGAGGYRANQNATFPDRNNGAIVSPFLGGGLNVPLGQRLRLFVDGRVALVSSTDADSVFGLSPVRAGLSWRF